MRMFPAKRPVRSTRSGAAVVELAIISPVVFMMALAVVDICNLIFMKQSLTIAAYEGVRVAIVPGANLYDVRTQVEDVCEARGVKPPTVTIEPSNFSSATLGDMIKVTVTAPTSNSFGQLGLMPSTQSASLTMMKEL